MNRLLVGAFTAALLICAINVRSTAFAEESESTGLPPQNTITMNFQNVDIPVLAKFISELGKPGPYAIRTRPTVQRWRVLKSPSEIGRAHV